MNIRRRITITLSVWAASLGIAAVASANGTPIMWYKMGEQEGGVNNGNVSSTLDSPVPVINGITDTLALDLSAVNSPVYRTISGRPDGGTGIGIEFSAAQSKYLSGLALNWPVQSSLAETQSGIYDLAGIDDRGFQFWVRPTSTAVQSLVMDTNQHGVRINSNGKFSMRYANTDYESSLTVVPNTWYHVEVVRPSGRASGSRMYVNGNAVAVATPSNDYASDQATSLTVGSNTDGNGEFFSGIIDDLRFFVLGTNDNNFNYGTFNFAADNAYAASTVSGIKGIAGDVTNDGVLNAADKTAFVNGWMDRRLVNGVQIGDLTSRSQGDLNLDGITNIQDLVILQNALVGAGIGTLTAADFAGVPEPSTLGLAVLAAITWLAGGRRANR